MSLDGYPNHSQSRIVPHLQLVPEPGREPTAGRDMSDCVSPAEQPLPADGPRSEHRSRSTAVTEAASRPAILFTRLPSVADLEDMEYLAATVLKAGHAALRELEDALEARNPGWVAASCRRVGALGGIARGRAATMEGRL